MASKKYTYRKTRKGLILPGPRSTNEIFVTDKSKGSMPNNERKAEEISLSSTEAVLSSLRTLYGAASSKGVKKYVTSLH